MFLKIINSLHIIFMKSVDGFQFDFFFIKNCRSFCFNIVAIIIYLHTYSKYKILAYTVKPKQIFHNLIKILISTLPY